MIRRDISSEDMEKLRDYLNDPSYEVEYSLAGFVDSGSKYRQIIYNSDNETLRLNVVPQSTSQKVEDTDVQVPVFAILFDHTENKACKIPTEKYEEIDVFPELRQAFYEGESYRDRDADYKYHFQDGEEVAVPSSNPIERLDEPVTITAVEYLGGHFPRKWLMETSESGYMYLRERSGSIRLYDKPSDGEEVFNAYIGREHPGTRLNDHEVLNIIESVDYINIADEYDTEVSEEAHNEYWNDFNEKFTNNHSFDEDVEHLFDDEQEG